MSPPPEPLQATAERALALMRAAGFEHAQVGASRTALLELNVNHDEPSLLRSTESRKLALAGVIDARKASAELSEFDPAVVAQRIAALFADAARAPQDDANAVSGGEQARVAHGPQAGDPEVLADKAAELLAFRFRETPRTMIEEAALSHVRVDSHTLTSAGSALACSLGWYEANASATAREGRRVSSFNYAGGTAHALADRPIAERFGLGEMLRDTERQIDTRTLGAKFSGEAILTPHAVTDLVDWLLEQISDTQLIAGTSLYRHAVGETIASPLLHLVSRFDAPGVAAVSADAFATPPVEVLRQGRLMNLTPSLYGSRKTGLGHVPVAAGGWELAAGATPLADMVAAVPRGALIGRLSMGNPASNGDFSGVIKNSFAIRGGALDGALAETMITGNVARMLRDVVAVSRERIDAGRTALPWLRIAGLQYS